MPSVLPALRRVAPCAAAVLLTVAGGTAKGGGQTDGSQQPPAPITRVRPRPTPANAQDQAAPVVRPKARNQTGVPVDAPPDAAPLAPRVARPKPVNPNALDGASTATGANTATGAMQRQRPATGAAGATGYTGYARPAGTFGAAGHTGTQAIRLPYPGATGHTGTQTTRLFPHPAYGASGHTGTSTIRSLTPRAPSATGTEATASSRASTTGSETAATTPPLRLSATGVNRTVIVLDPAHGGADSGSRIGDATLEKNVTLALALRLRSLLTARGFTVVLTRENDAPTEANAAGTPLTLDDRAGIANHMRAAACLLLHATGRGNGLHLYTSELQAAPGEASQLPWLTAQAAWVPASQALERSVSGALGRSQIALVSSAASVRPVDSLTCPALVMELAPENNDVRTINDGGYQDRIANAIAGALVFWQNQVQAPEKLSAPTTTHTPHHRAAATSSAGEAGSSRAAEREP